MTTWHTTWGVEVVVTALAALYLRTALHVGGWPVVRTVSAIAALAVVVVTVDSGLAGAVSGSVTAGVEVQLLFLAVVPALWVAGRPGELASRERAGPALARLGGSAVVRGLTSPPAALVVFALVMALTRLGPFPTATTATVLGPVVWLGAGLLLLGTARGPGRAGPRSLLLVAAAAVTAVVGLVVAAVPPGLGTTFPPDDVHRGGTILWAAGGGLFLALAAAPGRPR